MLTAGVAEKLRKGVPVTRIRNQVILARQVIIQAVRMQCVRRHIDDLGEQVPTLIRGSVVRRSAFPFSFVANANIPKPINQQ